MTELGDLFPQSFRKDFAERNIQIGSVIRHFAKDTIPPKIKYFIVVGFADDQILLGTVFINTNINSNLFKTEYLKGLHVPLDSAIHDFIEHDSFIDCSTIRERSIQEMKQLLESDPESFKGTVSDTLLETICQTIKTATTISTKQKRKYGFL